MLSNIVPVTELRGLARRRARLDEFKTVRNNTVDQETAKGWIVANKNRTTTRLRHPKDHFVLLEDRVWSILYRMGFTHISGEGGAIIATTDDEGGSSNRLGIVAIDDEVGIVVDCRSSEVPKRFGGFQDFLDKLLATKENATRDLRKQYPALGKRPIKYSCFLSNPTLGDADIERAHRHGTVVFDPTDLEYYEALVVQIGTAARFQFLADLLPDHRIAGLDLKVPAVRTKMGGYQCFTFSVSPEYLLKIAYVSHRSKGKASDVDTYQRMIKKSRLQKIRECLS